MSTTKKLHWTQTPEGRARIAAVARKGHRTRKAKAKAKQTKPRGAVPHATKAPERIDDGTFAYAHGYLTCWIDQYAARKGVPAGSLTAELGAVFQRQARR